MATCSKHSQISELNNSLQQLVQNSCNPRLWHPKQRSGMHQQQPLAPNSISFSNLETSMPSPTASCVEGKGMAAAPPFMLCLISIKRMFKDLRPQRSDLKLGLSLPLPAHCPNSSSPSAKTRPASKTGEAGVVIVVLEFWQGSVRFDSFPLPRSMHSQLATSVRSKQCLQPAATCTSKKGSSLHVKTSLQVTG